MELNRKTTNILHTSIYRIKYKKCVVVLISNVHEFNLLQFGRFTLHTYDDGTIELSLDFVSLISCANIFEIRNNDVILKSLRNFINKYSH